MEKKQSKIKHDSLRNDYEMEDQKVQMYSQKLLACNALGSEHYTMKTFIPGK